MSKEYKTKTEAKEAIIKAAGLRLVWENAIRNKATAEEMEKRGLKTVVINEY